MLLYSSRPSFQQPALRLARAKTDRESILCSHQSRLGFAGFVSAKLLLAKPRSLSLEVLSLFLFHQVVLDQEIDLKYHSLNSAGSASFG